MGPLINSSEILWLPVWVPSALFRKGNASGNKTQMSIGYIEQMLPKSPQDPLSSLCLTAWESACVYASLPRLFPSLCTLLFDRGARLSLSTKAFIRPSQPFPRGGPWAEESPSERALYLDPCQPLKRTLCRPAVKHRERQTWWISELRREAGTKRLKSANKKRWPLSHSPTLAHLFPLPVWAISISLAYLFPVLSFSRRVVLVLTRTSCGRGGSSH